MTSHVVVLGATGFVGGGIARHLLASGHAVTGLARTDAAADRLRAQGITPLAGDLAGRRAEVVTAATQADAVVYAAQPADPAQEAGLVEDLLDALAGSTTAFLFVSGSGVLLERTAGAWSPHTYAEDDPFVVEPLAVHRLAAEQAVRNGARRGVRAMVLRPGTIWGPGDDHGHLAAVYRSVAVTGSACYVGEGLATYGHVHLDDVARLAERTLAVGTAGSLYHAAAGETPNRWIAEAVARDLGVPTRSLTPAEAVGVWGEMGALVLSASSRTRDDRTRAELGWAPQHTDLLTAVGDPDLRALARPSLQEIS
jgi:nucleoside-diphosphate-sugar epimerase